MTRLRTIRTRKNFRIRRRNPPLPLLLPPSRFQLLRNPSPTLQDLRELRKIRLPPFPPPHTNAQTHASNTSNQTCGRSGRRLQRLPSNLRSYTRRASPWLNRLRALQLEADN